MRARFLSALVLLLAGGGIFPIIVWAALIDINEADLAELDKISEVGPVIASRIIEYRSANGPFKSLEEIKNVKGIGEATFAKMKDQITIGVNSSSQNEGSVFQEGKLSQPQDNQELELSAHTNEKNLSNYKNEELKIGAGRDRLATVRTPLVFSAVQNKTATGFNYFSWNFGDGTNAIGKKVYHSYQFPGSYNVVLNGSIDGEEEATARLTVSVAEAKIKITEVNFDKGYVTITNGSSQEQNLNDWILWVGEKKHVFPLDTIISAQSSIKIPLGLIGLDSSGVKKVYLSYPDGGVASGATLVDQEEKSESPSILAEHKTSQVKAIPSKISQITNKSVIVLAKEPSWFERIKNALFK